MLRFSFAGRHGAFLLLLLALDGCAVGCMNIGSRFDFRKYPTPVAYTSLEPKSHVWCPDLPTEQFQKMMPQLLGPQNGTPGKPLPAGPASTASMTSCYPAFPSEPHP